MSLRLFQAEDDIVEAVAEYPFVVLKELLPPAFILLFLGIPLSIKSNLKFHKSLLSLEHLIDVLLSKFNPLRSKFDDAPSALRSDLAERRHKFVFGLLH